MKVLPVAIDSGCNEIGRSVDAVFKVGRLNHLPDGVGEVEIEIRAERGMDGIFKAKARRVQFSAQQKLSDKQVNKLRERRENWELIKHQMEAYRYLSAR